MKRLIIVHGWGGDSQQPMLARLGKIGTELGFETTVLDMPNPNVPTIDAWTKHLEDNVYYVDQDTYFIGHSLGCQAILRYLEMNKGSQLGGAIFIAPPFQVNGLDDKESEDIIRPWMERPIDFASIKKMSDKFVSVFSEDDTIVTLDYNKNVIEKGLGQKIIVVNGMGHFTKKDGITEVPVIVEILNSFK
ncbi:MAG: alpha/beta hydrolase [Candidatus Taylorbacteria bacterium]